MDVREKLIELIGKFCSGLPLTDVTPPYGYENLADYLISSGVTVREFGHRKYDFNLADSNDMDDEDFCEECKANGDDYYINVDGELECYCLDCYRMKMEDEWNDE